MPVFVGDPSKCTFCAKGEFPHQHQEKNEAEPSQTMSRSVARRVGLPINDSIRRRGRPPSPETIELFKVCEYNGNHPEA